MITQEEIKKLIETAKEARTHSFAFKSKHAFGASVLSTKGEYFGGCNIDAIISSQGICAESCAINNAVSHGHASFKALCVIDENFVYPCGTCLQYLTQFYQVSGKEPTIIVANLAGEYEETTLSYLLPKKFISKTFDETLKAYNK